jgi:hemolysin III
MSSIVASTIERTWWTRGRPFTTAELIADAVVHAIGLFVAISAGAVLVATAAFATAPDLGPALLVYWLTLLTLLGASVAFNLTPISPTKRLLAKLDQSAIFLFIAGTYTPLLAAVDSPAVSLMLKLIWIAALIGVALKLTVPSRFGRWSFAVYFALAWSGLAVIGPLTGALPATTASALLAGGIAYASGMVFHFWERLRFHNAIWHAFVVAGASLHLFAILDLAVISRL